MSHLEEACMLLQWTQTVGFILWLWFSLGGWLCTLCIWRMALTAQHLGLIGKGTSVVWERSINYMFVAIAVLISVKIENSRRLGDKKLTFPSLV